MLVILPFAFRRVISRLTLSGIIPVIYSNSIQNIHLLTFQLTVSDAFPGYEKALSSIVVSSSLLVHGQFRTFNPCCNTRSYVPSKVDLGAAAKTKRPTSCVLITPPPENKQWESRELFEELKAVCTDEMTQIPK